MNFSDDVQFLRTFRLKFTINADIVYVLLVEIQHIYRVP